MPLTKQEKCFFDVFGYLSFPGLFAGEAEDLTQAFETVWTAHGGGHNQRPHDHQQNSALLPFIDHHPYLCALLDDERVERIGAGLLGEDFNYMSSDGNYFVGDTVWHSDGYQRAPGYRSIKLALYLDPVGRDTGALRVIPGSHIVNKAREHLGFAVNDCTNALGVHGRDVPCVSLDSNPGDLVVFHHTTLHASYGGSESRRMFTYNMSQHYADEHLDDLHKYLGVVDGVAKSCYGPILVDTAGPERRRHLQQVLDSTSAAKPQER